MSDSKKACGGKPTYCDMKDELWFLEHLSDEERESLVKQVMPCKWDNKYLDMVNIFSGTNLSAEDINKVVEYTLPNPKFSEIYNPVAEYVKLLAGTKGECINTKFNFRNIDENKNKKD